MSTQEPLDCFALKIRTAQGFWLGVGGICRASTAPYWTARMAALQNLYCRTGDIFQVDYDLAESLERLSEGSLVVVGATLWAAGLELPEGVRTGGVIGSPRLPIASAAGTAEELPEGFFESALPGGPGLVARAPKAAVESALCHIQAVGAQKAALQRVLASQGIVDGLVVFDGTGRDAPGCLLACTQGCCQWVSVKGCNGQESENAKERHG